MPLCVTNSFTIRFDSQRTDCARPRVERGANAPLLKFLSFDDSKYSWTLPLLDRSKPSEKNDVVASVRSRCRIQKRGAGPIDVEARNCYAKNPRFA